VFLFIQVSQRNFFYRSKLFRLSDTLSMRTAENHVTQELRNLIHTANAPIFGTDKSGVVTKWNNKVAELTGFSQAETLGKHLIQNFVCANNRASVQAILDRCLVGEETCNVEIPLLKKGCVTSTEVVHVLLNTTTRRDINGQIVGFFGVAQDVSEAKKFMAREAEFVKAQAANDAKSHFLASMSHEMRTPLNIINGNNDLILETCSLDDERHAFATQIKTATASLMRAVNDILDFTKIESGQMLQMHEDFDIRKVVDDKMDVIARQAMSKGLEIWCFIDPEINTLVNGDPDRLRQILNNLLQNAIKFTDSGQVYLEVELLHAKMNHTTFCFHVFDSGIGISKEKQGKLFESFVQGDDSSTRSYGGMGIGLALARQLAIQMNGTMSVESDLGAGSHFWFTASFSECACSELQAGVPPTASLVDETGKGINVVVVATIDELRRSLIRTINCMAFSAIGVRSMEQLDIVCKSSRVDILIVCPDVLPAQTTRSSKSPGSKDLSACFKHLSGMTFFDSNGDGCGGDGAGDSGGVRASSVIGTDERGRRGCVTATESGGIEDKASSRGQPHVIVLCPITQFEQSTETERARAGPYREDAAALDAAGVCACMEICACVKRECLRGCSKLGRLM
jgi:PAS domain S-box-containing protein